MSDNPSNDLALLAIKYINKKTKNSEKSWIERITQLCNQPFYIFFHPLPYFFGETDESVLMLEREPMFKKFQWILLIILFAYLSYYIFNKVTPDKNDYLASSIWMWNIMFAIVVLVIRP